MSTDNPDIIETSKAKQQIEHIKQHVNAIQDYMIENNISLINGFFIVVNLLLMAIKQLNNNKDKAKVVAVLTKLLIEASEHKTGEDESNE